MKRKKKHQVKEMFKLSFKQRLTKEMNFLGYQSIMATKT